MRIYCKSIKQIDIYERKGHSCQDNFIHFGQKIELSEKQIQKLIAFFLVELPKVAGLMNNIFEET